MGKRFLSSGRFAEAAPLFERALDLIPSSQGGHPTSSLEAGLGLAEAYQLEIAARGEGASSHRAGGGERPASREPVLPPTTPPTIPPTLVRLQGDSAQLAGSSGAEERAARTPEIRAASAEGRTRRQARRRIMSPGGGGVGGVRPHTSADRGGDVGRRLSLPTVREPSAAGEIANAGVRGQGVDVSLRPRTAVVRRGGSAAAQGIRAVSPNSGTPLDVRAEASLSRSLARPGTAAAHGTRLAAGPGNPAAKMRPATAGVNRVGLLQGGSKAEEARARMLRPLAPLRPK